MKQVWTAVGAIVAVVGTIFAVVLFKSAMGTIAFPIPPPATPTANVTPTPFYSADWSNGSDGWALPPDWQVLSGALVNDGTAKSLIFPPYATSNFERFTVATEVQVPDALHRDNFGFFLTGTDDLVLRAIMFYGHSTPEVIVCPASASDTPFPCNGDFPGGRIPFNPGTLPHTWKVRVAAGRLRFTVDDSELYEYADNRLFSPVRVGFQTWRTRLTIRNFRIIVG